MLEKVTEKVSEKYVCKSCDYKTSYKTNYNKHLGTRKHTILTNADKSIEKVTEKVSEKVSEKYVCVTCDYKTSHKYNYIKHLDTRKHAILTNNKKVSQNHICECGMTYKHRQSLHKHKKICQYKVVSKTNTTGNTYNTNNNTTNNFNLNVFLNETCKDAINMSDFIKNLTVELKDLVFTKKNGIVDSVSNIFVNGLNALEIEKRPIHCTDQKRKTLYIKDENKWEKDNHQMLDESIKNIKEKHKDPIKEWEDQHPNWNESEKLTQEYLQFVKSVIENIGETDEKKIIKNISNEVQIKELKG